MRCGSTELAEVRAPFNPSPLTTLDFRSFKGSTVMAEFKGIGYLLQMPPGIDFPISKFWSPKTQENDLPEIIP